MGGVMNGWQMGLLVSIASLGCIAPARSGGDCTCPTSGGASGSTAAASSPTPSVPAVVPSGALFSDGTSISLMNIDPAGSWFTMNDKSPKGTMVPASTGEFTSAIIDGAIHTKGSGFADWGGGIGLNFVGAQMLTPLDASGFTGISFKASGSGAMHVGLATMATMPEFGLCTKCYDHYAVDITDLSSAGKVYKFTWSQLRAAGWGSPKKPLDPKTLVGLNFTSKGAMPWDFTLDDLQFTK
jgi:hypothetical protein